MINVEQKAKSVLATLYQIQPKINVLGLTEEAERLTEMKIGLVELVEELHKDNMRLTRVVGSLREDALSSFVELRQIGHTTMSGDLTDAKLHEASLVAEVFVARAQDYLASKEQFKAMNKGGV